MSIDDDQPEWFSGEGSSNPVDRPKGFRSDYRLEAVPSTTSEADASDWFDQSSAEPDSADGPLPDADRPRGRSRALGAKSLFAGSVAVVLLALAGAAWFLSSLLGGSDTSTAAPLTVPSTPAATSSPAEAATPSAAAVSAPRSKCEETSSPTVTTGDGAGDTDSVAGVVLAFQHAYYVARDSKKIEPLLAKDSTITDLGALQAGIDSVERDTTHCLCIVSDGDGAASVELTETAPDDAQTVYKQRVTTTRESGKVRIVSIEDKS
ncbi:hypothetical protein [Rhodococcus sp. IEGM 1408]|uniref:hypothetical protein n=1 Tax=Rhodococcus sp. IEGM 1408 TaxID=3082220 RepID=UPI0029529B99|nr:hypothetical protein [Rhodococcus sp. IEGM 1408]MDV8002852.1 hypothetical protein [Rhodococcus sp. IEGM 1408]